MKKQVIAIGMDSADPELLNRWMSEGKLPHLNRLRQSGSYCPLENHIEYAGGRAPYGNTEGSWVMLQTGVAASTTGYFETIDYNQQTYQATSDPERGGFDYLELEPIFALGNDYRIATLDLPVSIVSPGVNGIQVNGWGGHFPFVQRGSKPKSLLDELSDEYGKNEILYNDHGVFWKKNYLKWLEETSISAIEQRTRICLDLMNREPWDLFLNVITETHGASHDLWFTSDKNHPVHAAWKGSHDPLLSVFQAADRSLGQIAANVPADSHLVCFSVHGMEPNISDVNSFFLLPELLYRFNFPGKIGFAKGKLKAPLRPPYMSGTHWYWCGEIWRRKHAKTALGRAIRSLLPGWLVWPPGKDLNFPYTLDWFGPAAGWMPAVWYQPAWPRMRSFGLPSFSDGHIRINLAGRESQGIVQPKNYEEECDRISEFVLGVTNGRTGKPIVRDIIRTRRS
ncbi:MAG: hypothetical protein N2C12_10830, partial [Planctomycetales bacterium]